MRRLRKHRTAFIALAVYHFIFFFPTLFMQRVPSPNDVFFNYDPWNHVRSVNVQNSLLNDPPTSYFTLMSLVKNDWRAFHWNPFIACGIPGFGSSAAAVLSPFILLPTLALPLTWVYAGIILLKLNGAFFFAYLWLREEKFGKAGAAIGAIVIAASGAYVVRWWWQATNATALYPALLWIARRTMEGKRVRFWCVVLIALAYALAGFPSAMLYGAYLVLAYVAVLALVRRRLPSGWAATGIILGFAIATPSIVPFVQFLERSGWLITRVHSLPLRYFELFVKPDMLGNRAYHNWTGDWTLGALNNYIEITVYAGLVPLLLLVVATFNRRARWRWFWFGVLAVTLACMFGLRAVMDVIAHLPLLRYSPLTRLQLLLPLPIGYLAAAGASMLSRRRTWLAALFALLVSADLGVFAGRFYPYIAPELAVPPVTPTIAYLQAQPKPFRIAPFMNYMWPNSSELYRLEDIRSHFSSEAAYRRLLLRVDPTSSSTQQTVIAFNSLKYNFADPINGMLGIRYYIEHKQIDILKWTIFSNSKPGVRVTGIMLLQPGMTLQRRVRVDTQPFYALEIPVTMRATRGRTPQLIVSLMTNSSVLYTRTFTPADINVMNKVYVPVYEFARPGDTLVLRVHSIGIQAEMVKGATDVTGDSPLFYARVGVPLIFDRELPDGRLFRNAGEVPRFHSVKRISKMSHDEFIGATTSVDFRDEAAITDGSALTDTADAAVTLRSYAQNRQEIFVDAPAGTFLASSEKLTPELQVRIDGRIAKPVEINMVFAGVKVPAGRHTVVFSRRLARGWWWVSALAAFVAVALALIDGARPR